MRLQLICQQPQISYFVWDPQRIFTRIVRSLETVIFVGWFQQNLRSYDAATTIWHVAPCHWPTTKRPRKASIFHEKIFPPLENSRASLNCNLEQLLFSPSRSILLRIERKVWDLDSLISDEIRVFFPSSRLRVHLFWFLIAIGINEEVLQKLGQIRCFLKASWDFISPYVRSISNGCFLFCSRILSDAVVAGSAVWN